MTIRTENQNILLDLIYLYSVFFLFSLSKCENKTKLFKNFNNFNLKITTSWILEWSEPENLILKEHSKSVLCCPFRDLETCWNWYLGLKAVKKKIINSFLPTKNLHEHAGTVGLFQEPNQSYKTVCETEDFTLQIHSFRLFNVNWFVTVLFLHHSTLRRFSYSLLLVFSHPDS